MQKTEHYQLNQWEKTDRILMADFNADNAKIDAAINAVAAAAGNCRIAIGSYVGTGTYGIDHPNTLTFDFQPKIFMISGANTLYQQMYTWFRGQTTGAYNDFLNPNVSYQVLQVRWEGNSIQWYSTDAGYNLANAACQLNEEGQVYHYAVIY